MINDSDAMTTTATIEFESHEDVLSARTRDGKEIDGQVIHIQSGSQSTLYVANYPEDYDEVKIRELFKDVSICCTIITSFFTDHPTVWHYHQCSTSFSQVQQPS